MAAIKSGVFSCLFRVSFEEKTMRFTPKGPRTERLEYFLTCPEMMICGEEVRFYSQGTEAEAGGSLRGGEILLPRD
jgi:hypothetical protein